MASSQPAPVQQVYGALAPTYEQRWSGYVARSTAWALHTLAPSPGTVVLDLGCGTGYLIHNLREQQPTVRVYGMDLTRAMLDVARQRQPDVAFVQASGVALPFAEACVDAVISTSALHYVPDPLSVLREVHRVLKPGGTLVVTDWCRDDWMMWLLDLGLRSVLRSLDPAHARVLRSAELRDFMMQAGFIGITVARRKIDRFWGLMTVSGRA